MWLAFELQIHSLRHYVDYLFESKMFSAWRWILRTIGCANALAPWQDNAVQRFGDLSMSSWAQAIDQNSGFVGMCK
jgi:hypothetical protein